MSIGGKMSNIEKNQVEHLRMLQGIIGRMASTSLGIKRYALMVFTFGASYLIIRGDKKDVGLLVLALFLVVMMLLFDMYYLSMERQYRDRYEKDRVKINSSDLFELSILKVSPKDFCATFLSKSIWIFYMPLLIALVVIFILK